MTNDANVDTGDINAEIVLTTRISVVSMRGVTVERTYPRRMPLKNFVAELYRLLAN